MSRGRRKVVCSFCRKRKIRCDMQTPCRACVRFRNPYCDMAEIAQKSKVQIASPASLETNLKKSDAEVSDVEVLHLRLALLERLMMEMAGQSNTGANMVKSAPILLSEAKFSFQDTIKPVEYLDGTSLRRLGLLRWIVMVSLDDGLLRALQHLLPCKNNVNSNSNKPANFMEISACTESLQPVSALTRAPGILRADIQAALPLKRRVWMLVDRFFNVQYPFVPVLDEFEFRAAVAGVIGPKKYAEEQIELQTHNDNDFAHLGLLLAVLRMSYLSLVDNRNRVRTFCFYNLPLELAYLAEVEVAPSCIQLAEECVRQYDVVRDVRLECIQLLAILRVLTMYNPESNSPDVHNQTYLAILFLLLLLRWLNREPRTVFNMDSIDYRKTMMLRKIWHTVVDIDLHASVFSGNLLVINPDSYDVQLPVFRANGLNIDNTSLDAAVCNAFSQSDDVRQVLFDAIAYTGKVSGPVLLDSVEEIETRLQQKENDLYNVVSHHANSRLHNIAESFARVSDFYSFIRVYYVLVGINAHLYYYHVRQQNWDVAFQHRHYFVTVMTKHLLPFLPLLLDEDKNPFGGTCDLVATSVYFNCIMQTVVLVWAMYMDYKMQLHFLSRQPHLANDVTIEYNEQHAALMAVTDLLFQLVSCMGNAVELTLERYKFNNKILKGHNLISKLASEPEYFDKQSAPVQVVAADRLNEINALVVECLQNDAFLELSDAGQLLTPSSSLSLPLVNSFANFEPNFDLLLFEDLFTF